MSISQAKIELAVLWKLFQHSENNGEAIQAQSIRGAFSVDLPIRRIQLALEQLETIGDVVKGYDRYADDECDWKITRDGLTKVDRALRAPASFIFRLNENGDRWLEGEDAKKAILKSITKPVSNTDAINSPETPSTAHPQITISNVFSPTASHTLTANHGGSSESNSSVIAGWVSAWGSWAAVVVAILAFIATLWIAGKI